MKIKYINAHIIDAFQNFTGTVCTEDGVITYAGEKNDSVGFDHTVDVKGYALMPAFIDMHAHFRTPGYKYKEDFHTGFNAALKGGYGTVCGMANTLPVMDNAELVKENLDNANALKKLNYIQITALGKGLKDDECVDFNSLKKYTNYFSNDGNTVFSEIFMTECLKASLKYDFIIGTHCQPEEEIIQRDLNLLKKYGGNLHICHISTKETLKMIVAAKKSGLKFTCEVTPHHLFAYGLDYKVNPSIAQKSDVEALIEGIKNNMIDVLATDHAPHSEEDKQNGSPGIDNIEYAFQVYLKVFSDNGINICKLSEMISYKPAFMLKLNKGLIKVGYDADFVIADLNHTEKINSKTFLSKSNNTPFDGREVKGKILKTIIHGEERYDCTQTL